MLRPGDILDRKYRIIEAAGEGGMSKVWLARDEKLGKLWAVKEISKMNKNYQELVDEDRTLKELEITKDLNHPAIPRVVDIIDEEYTIYIVRDWIDGDNLEDLLEEHGAVKEEIAVAWLIDICDILSYLHNLDPPIIFKDIKPGNIMLDRDGNLKLIDFGISKKFVEGNGQTSTLGSEGFAAPEQYKGYVDIRSDIYSLGVTGYYLLTGKHPQDLKYPLQPIRNVDPSLSQGLEKVINKATQRPMDARYQTAEEFARALDSYRKLDDDYIAALRKKINRHKRMIAASVALFITGAALFGAGLINDRNSYNNLVESPGGTIAAKEESLSKAISINPRNERAYIALIEAYSEDGKFTEDESARFFTEYNRHKGSVPPDVNYAIGESYLQYYTGTSDNSARAKLLTAEPFFLGAREGENAERAESYVHLAECYRNYVISDDSLLTRNVTREDLQGLLDSGRDAVTEAQGVKMKSLLAEAVFGLIDQERIDMRDAGIEEQEILADIDAMCSDIDDDALAQAEELKKNVKLTYSNGRKKEGGEPNA